MMLSAISLLLLLSAHSSTSIISIHRSSSNKPSCENGAWLNGLDTDNCQLFEGVKHGNTDESTGYLMGNVKSGNETSYSRLNAITYSLISSVLVGLSGILPLILMPFSDKVQTRDSETLNRLLSFAVGGLLGDVFLHLLPESWNLPYSSHEKFHHDATVNGIWVLVGLISFCLLEKLFPDDPPGSENDEISDNPKENIETSHQNCNGNNNIENWSLKNGHAHEKIVQNGDAGKNVPNSVPEKPSHTANVKMSGYLNLFANFIDNFTHGLAIGGSYLASRWVGILTTAAILLHEIPHEIGDFAILLRAGFDRWKAAKYQLLTATGGVLGALFAHLVDSDSSGGSVAWILPFTSGGFIYIALCTVVPDLMKDTTSPKASVIQLSFMIAGIAVMGLVSLIE